MLWITLRSHKHDFWNVAKVDVFPFPNCTWACVCWLSDLSSFLLPAWKGKVSKLNGRSFTSQVQVQHFTTHQLNILISFQIFTIYLQTPKQHLPSIIKLNLNNNPIMHCVGDAMTLSFTGDLFIYFLFLLLIYALVGILLKQNLATS